MCPRPIVVGSDEVLVSRIVEVTMGALHTAVVEVDVEHMEDDAAHNTCKDKAACIPLVGTKPQKQAFFSAWCALYTAPQVIQLNKDSSKHKQMTNENPMHKTTFTKIHTFEIFFELQVVKIPLVATISTNANMNHHVFLLQ